MLWTNSATTNKLQAANSDDDITILFTKGHISKDHFISINETNVVINNSVTTINSINEHVASINQSTSPKLLGATTQKLTKRYQNTLVKMKTTTRQIQNSTRTIPSKRQLKPTELTPLCGTFTEAQLYQKLEKVGGRNQRFMANTPEEAGKNFAELIPHHDEYNEYEADAFSDALPVKRRQEDGCDSSCSEITQKLREWLNDEEGNHRNMNETLVHDHGPAEVQEGKPGSYKTSCSLEQFIPVSNCTVRGEEEIWGYEKLCSACHGIYMLSKDCFPRFLNSITCDNGDARCIFDKVPNAHGKCQLRTLSFKVLRNKGTMPCEEWTYEYIDVPIACECFLDKSSSWLSATEE